MPETAKIGSSEWWTGTADKIIGVGLDVLRYKTTSGNTDGGSTTTPGQSVSTSMLEGKLPYILGGVAVVAVFFLMRHR